MDGAGAMAREAILLTHFHRQSLNMEKSLNSTVITLYRLKPEAGASAQASNPIFVRTTQALYVSFKRVEEQRTHRQQHTASKQAKSDPG